MYEHNSTQTQTEGASKTMVSVQTDTDGLETKDEAKEEVVKELDGIGKSTGPGSHYSDISDDLAPVLSKIVGFSPFSWISNFQEEAPATNGVAANPSTSATGESSSIRRYVPISVAVPEKTPTPQSAVVQPTHVVPPITASPRGQSSSSSSFIPF